MRCSSSLTVEPGKSGLPVAISYWMQPTPLQGAMGRANISLGDRVAVLRPRPPFCILFSPGQSTSQIIYFLFTLVFPEGI